MGSGMAAASSMMSSSACETRSACCGWMYCTVWRWERKTFTRTIALPARFSEERE